MGKVPLGLAYIASALQKRGHYVEGYNLVVDPLENIEVEKFDYVGITVLTAFISHTRKLAEALKARNPNIKIVIGGPHPSMKIQHSLEGISPCIDFVIAGEGEISMCNLVESDQPRSGFIPGVYFLEDGQVKGRPYESISNLDELPYPNQRMFDHGNLEPINPFRSFMTSRGCPFKCFNCQPYLKQVFSFRTRTPENAVKEMLYLNETYGQDYFGFIDSEFPINKLWFKRFVGLTEASGLDFSFHCNAFSRLVDEEVLIGYKKMNVTRVAIGVESGNQHVVDNVLHKRIDLPYTRKVFEMAQKHQVTTHAYFMIGIPGETLDNMQETLDYALNLETNSLEFNILTPWPGTKFYEMCEEKKWLDMQFNYEDYNEKRLGVISTDQWTHRDVTDFFRHVQKEFTNRGWTLSGDGTVYFRPGEKMPDAGTVAQIKQQFHLDT